MRVPGPILAVLLACLALPGRAAATLCTFDLTPTLGLDRSRPANCRRIWDIAHFATSLQGVANRREPLLYLYYVGGDSGAIDRYWMRRLRSRGEWWSRRRVEPLPDLAALVRRFRSCIRGLVVYDERVPATSNVASTVAGVERLACVRYDPAPGSLFHWLTRDPAGPHLPVRRWLLRPDGTRLFTGSGMIPGTRVPSTGSAKCDAYLWAKIRYLDSGLCDAARLGYYMDAYWITHPQGTVANHTLTNQDYFIAHRGFLFDLSPWSDETPVDDPRQPHGADYRTLKAILASAYRRTHGRAMIHIGGFLPWDKKYTNQPGAGGKHTPVAGEWRYAEIISCFNAYMDSDALGYSAMANASAFQHYPLARRYPQRLPTVADLKARGFILPDGRVAPRQFVSFYVGDYDSAAWLYQLIPQNWDDPARGKVPIGWAFNPNLADRFPVGMAYTRKTATPLDSFVAGDSGAGYLNPGYLATPRPWSGLPSGTATWEAHCRRYYRQWGIRLTGFIIDGNAPAMPAGVRDAYARFSPAGIICLKSDRMGLHRGMPFLRMTNLFIGDLEGGVRTILHDAAVRTPGFLVYRNVFWRATSQKQLMDAVHATPGGSRIQFVDPYTLMLLVKQFHSVGQRAQESRSLWDVGSGARVTGCSPHLDAFDPRDALGGEFGRNEEQSLIFQDGVRAPGVHWLEWRTPQPVTVARYAVYAHGDGAGHYREFGAMRLLVGLADGGWQVVDEFTPTHPYTYESGPPVHLLHTRSWDRPITAQRFRAEFEQYDAPGAPGGGPRVVEMQGFGPRP